MGLLSKLRERLGLRGPVATRKAREEPSFAWRRWAPSEFAAARLHLSLLSKDGWTERDYLLACEFLIQRYLPADFVVTQAQHAIVMARLRDTMRRSARGEAISAKPDPAFVSWLDQQIAAALTGERQDDRP